MNVRSKHRIKCNREQVWEKLMDINFLGKVIPGGETFSHGGRGKYEGTLRVKVGFFKSKLKATLTIERLRMPRSFRLRVYATGNGTKIRGRVDFRLKRIGECETELSYKGNLDFGTIPGFVLGKVHKKLKRAIRDLCNKIEKDCKCDDKRRRIEDSEEPVRDVSKVESQFEQEMAELIGEAQRQFEAELAALVTKIGSQLKGDLIELVSRIENQRQEEDGNAH